MGSASTASADPRPGARCRERLPPRRPPPLPRRPDAARRRRRRAPAPAERARLRRRPRGRHPRPRDRGRAAPVPAQRRARGRRRRAGRRPSPRSSGSDRSPTARSRAVRERETLRRDLAAARRPAAASSSADPGLAALGAEVARRLARARCGRSRSTPRDGAERRRRARPTGSAPTSSSRSAPAPSPARGARTSRTRPSAPRAASALATQLTEALRDGAPRRRRPVGRTYRLLRETRMAAVVCELCSRDDAGRRRPRSRRRVPRARATRWSRVSAAASKHPLDVTP